MKRVFKFIKTTLLGGVVFLLPIVILVTVLDKAIKIVMKIAEPINKWLPTETVAGVAVINLMAVFLVIAICFLAGFAARSILGKKLFQSIDNKLLIIPGYAYYKAKLSGHIGEDKEKPSLTPVFVKMGPRSQIGLAIEEVEGNRMAVFLPGAPDPWRGSIVIVDKEQVMPLRTDLKETLQIFESLGRGTAELLRKK